MPFIIISVILLFVLVLPAAIIIIPSVSRKKKISAFLDAHPDYVKMRVFMGSSSSVYRIKVFSVNGEKPVFSPNGSNLYLAAGKNQIIAQYQTENENQQTYSVLGAVIGGLVGAIINFIFVSKSDKKMTKPENGIVIDIETKKNGDYEMKADSYEDSINITCLEGEWHDIKSYQ